MAAFFPGFYSQEFLKLFLKSQALASSYSPFSPRTGMFSQLPQLDRGLGTDVVSHPSSVLDSDFLRNTVKKKILCTETAVVKCLIFLNSKTKEKAS